HEILQKWNAAVTSQIDSVRFIKGTKQIPFSLPIPASSCSHFEFDIKLLERAVQKGARALCGTTVHSLRMPCQAHYELELSNGQSVTARHLIIGTGKIPKKGANIEVPEMKYFGFKAHFKDVDIDNAIEMHLFPGGYLGITKVNATTTNIAA